MISKREIKGVMGEWLETLEWDVFATWTFDRLVRLPGAMYWAGKHLDTLEDWVNGWGSENPSSKNGWGYCEKATTLPRKKVYAFVAAEEGGKGGLIHLHALVGNVASITTYCGRHFRVGQWGKSCCMVHAWPCGIARVMPYNPDLGARFYVSKYITKQLAEWALLGVPRPTLLKMPKPAG